MNNQNLFEWAKQNMNENDLMKMIMDNTPDFKNKFLSFLSSLNDKHKTNSET